MNVEGRAVLKQIVGYEIAPLIPCHAVGRYLNPVLDMIAPRQIYIGTVFEEELNHLQSAPVCRFPQHRPTVRTDGMNPRWGVIDQLSDGFDIPASCRGDNDFQEIALISSELDVWH